MKMDSQQMVMEKLFERLLAKMDADRKTDKEEMEANRKTDKEEMVKEMKANQVKADADRVQMHEMFRQY
jgi:hypothetical protein